MGWLLLLVVFAFGASKTSARDLPRVDDSEARHAAQQLAVVAASSKPAVRNGTQASPLVKELQARMGDPDPDGRLGQMTRALASRYGVMIP